jgi:hypothetical protein
MGRAAFEAAQGLLLLVSAQDFDYAGALAYVYGLKKDHDIAQAHAADLAGKPAEEGGPGWLEKAIEEVQDTWDDLSPGKGPLVRRAAAELAGRWNKKPDNWAGVHPGKELNHRLPLVGFTTPPGAPNITTILGNAYRALNRDTHPRTVVRPLAIQRTADGALHTDLESRDLAFLAGAAATIAAAALNLGVLAISVRASIT